MTKKEKQDNFNRQDPADYKLLSILILLIIVSVIFVHWPALSSRTILFDDDQYLVDNNLVQNPSFESAKRFLTEVLNPSTVAGYYQPLTMISLMIDHATGGTVDNLMPFHRTSLILHAGNTVLILLFLFLLFRNVWVAFSIALIFGLHPMTIETICWVGERKTILATFFALNCLILYIKFCEKPKLVIYISFFLMYIMAIMAKPTALPLPFLMLLLDYWPLNKLTRKSVLEKIPLFIVAAVFAVITYLSQKNTAAVITPEKQGISHILLVLCHNIFFYPYKMLWPVNLSSHYPFPNPVSLSSPMILKGLIVTCILIPLLIISLRWTRALATGWLFFFIAIFPTMGVVGFTNAIASDKYAYLPSLGFLMIAAYFLSKSVTNSKVSIKYLLILLIVLLTSSETFASRQYLKFWRDSKTIYKYMLNLAPQEMMLKLMLGCDDLSSKEKEDGINFYKYILKIKPDYARAYNCLGLIYKSNGDFDEAIFNFQKALELKPSMFEVYNNLGNTYAKQQKFDLAKDFYHKSLDLNPRYTESIYNLATVLKSQGKFDEAIFEYSRLLKIDQEDEDAYFDLGSVFQSSDKYNEAIQCYLKTIEIDPSYAKAHNNIAGILLMACKFDLAAEHFQKAVDLQPNYTIALNGLAHILATHPEVQKRNPQKAIALGQKAADLTNYQDIQILDTLFNAYLSAGQINNVISTLETMQKLALQNNDKQWLDYINEQLKTYQK